MPIAVIRFLRFSLAFLNTFDIVFETPVKPVNILFQGGFAEIMPIRPRYH